VKKVPSVSLRGSMWLIAGRLAEHCGMEVREGGDTVREALAKP
jgi:hypothetical protein